MLLLCQKPCHDTSTCKLQSVLCNCCCCTLCICPTVTYTSCHDLYWQIAVLNVVVNSAACTFMLIWLHPCWVRVWGEFVSPSAECLISIECPAMIMRNPRDINLRCCNRVWYVAALSVEWLQSQSAEQTDVFWSIGTQNVAAACMSAGLTLHFCTKEYFAVQILHLPRSNQPERLNVCIKLLLTCRVRP